MVQKRILIFTLSVLGLLILSDIYQISTVNHETELKIEYLLTESKYSNPIEPLKENIYIQSRTKRSLKQYYQRIKNLDSTTLIDSSDIHSIVDAEDREEVLRHLEKIPQFSKDEKIHAIINAAICLKLLNYISAKVGTWGGHDDRPILYHDVFNNITIFQYVPLLYESFCINGYHAEYGKVKIPKSDFVIIDYCFHKNGNQTINQFCSTDTIDVRSLN